MSAWLLWEPPTSAKQLSFGFGLRASAQQKVMVALHHRYMTRIDRQRWYCVLQHSVCFSTGDPLLQTDSAFAVALYVAVSKLSANSVLLVVGCLACGREEDKYCYDAAAG